MVDDSICTEVFHDCNEPGRKKKEKNGLALKGKTQHLALIPSVGIPVEMIEECFA